MSTLVLDQPTIEKLMMIVGDSAEIRDQKGVLWGYFKPVISSATVDQYECPVSEEELDRRETEGGGRPLTDILKELDSRNHS
jgi:hypothetical protein